MDALSAQGNLSEARPASPAHILRATTNSVAPGGQSTLLTTTAPSIGGSSQTRPIERRGWVNSYEQTWVNFRERQGRYLLAARKADLLTIDRIRYPPSAQALKQHAVESIEDANLAALTKMHRKSDCLLEICTFKSSLAKLGVTKKATYLTF